MKTFTSWHAALEALGCRQMWEVDRHGFTMPRSTAPFERSGRLVVEKDPMRDGNYLRYIVPEPERDWWATDGTEWRGPAARKKDALRLVGETTSTTTDRRGVYRAGGWLIGTRANLEQEAVA